MQLITQYRGYTIQRINPHCSLESGISFFEVIGLKENYQRVWWHGGARNRTYSSLKRAQRAIDQYGQRS